MTQDAVVLKTLPGGKAEIAVTRSTACGGSCSSCESCIYANEMHIIASNPVDAQRGQKVTIRSSSALVYRAAALVYILPLVLLLAGYFAASMLGGSEGVCILVSFLAMAAGVILLVVTQKNKKPIHYEIFRIE